MTAGQALKEFKQLWKVLGFYKIHQQNHQVVGVVGTVCDIEWWLFNYGEDDVLIAAGKSSTPIQYLSSDEMFTLRAILLGY